MKSFESKESNHRIFICITIVFLTYNCVQKKTNQAAYWQEYLSFQKALSREFPSGGIRNALYGNLTSADETFLQEKEGILSIDFYLRKTNHGFQSVLTADKVPDNVPYKIHVDYVPSSFKDQKTYRMKRKTESILPAFSYLDFFSHVDQLQNFFRFSKDVSSKFTKISVAHQYLCSVSNCDIGRAENSSWLMYELDESTGVKFPEFYKKMFKLLNQVSYRITIFKSGDFLSGIELYNEKTKTFLKIPDTPPGYWLKPETLHIRVSLFIQAYGLKIDIRSLGYRLRFSSSKNYEKITGEFSKIPEKKISGRFLQIFPPGMVNWFIPGDIEEYFDNFFTLLVHGSDGNGGNRFESEAYRVGNKMKVILRSEAEIFRERFKLFQSSGDKDDTPAFFEVLEKILIDDLQKSPEGAASF
ncbi:hypothetical protein A0128_00120 [Leptospira tipperaryensis]|uniref:Lipoprotein n=1 Tax=Leptospira tipperaryensis TaxID=2564040 RepID=A0A1D7US67_9LEPT|nr:hypothetical protein [Leptospira tipperaryensis]AOP32427.1 hypothetical protein A0128_00120 [Leptospira tipperaryensis]